MNFKTTSSYSGMNTAVIERTFRAASRLSVEQSAEVVLEEAEALVPVRSGELRESGHVEVDSDATEDHAYVVFDAPHAQFVEYGTGVTGDGTYPYELPEEGVPITGSWVYDYKKQNWHGMEAQPYARPALDTARPAIIEIFRGNADNASAILGGS